MKSFTKVPASAFIIKMADYEYIKKIVHELRPDLSGLSDAESYWQLLKDSYINSFKSALRGAAVGGLAGSVLRS